MLSGEWLALEPFSQDVLSNRHVRHRKYGAELIVETEDPDSVVLVVWNYGVGIAGKSGFIPPNWCAVHNLVDKVP
jgi:hypothetical protein